VVSLQPSLFTRLTMVEAELSAMKDMLAELTVNQDELRRDRDEWRWRAERLLADLQRGTWSRWGRRAAAALAAVTARFRALLASVQNRLSEMSANRDKLRQGRDQWRSGAKHIPMDRREFDSGGSARSVSE
jgi:chromosome condensin MukBEF ATPase and DNA-binding subunit MukB